MNNSSEIQIHMKIEKQLLSFRLKECEEENMLWEELNYEIGVEVIGMIKQV